MRPKTPIQKEIIFLGGARLPTPHPYCPPHFVGPDNPHGLLNLLFKLSSYGICSVDKSSVFRTFSCIYTVKNVLLNRLLYYSLLLLTGFDLGAGTAWC